MQCFLFPSSLCNELEAILNIFWWRNYGANKDIHWAKWSDLCFPKSMGGMGFRNLAQFNIALLVKQGWNIVANPSCLLARVLKEKYFPNTELLHSRVGRHPSYTWKSIWCAQGLLESDIGWRVGSSYSINIWSEAWIDGAANGKVATNAINPNFTLVSDLIDHSQCIQRIEVVHSLFSEVQANQILSMHISSYNPNDTVIWRHDRSGCYLVKSGYRLLAHGGDLQVSVLNTLTADQVRRLYSALWSLPIPSKLKVIFAITTNCSLCAVDLKTVDHIMFCSFTTNILSQLRIPIILSSLEQSWIMWLSNLFDQFDEKKRVLLVVSIWAICLRTGFLSVIIEGDALTFINKVNCSGIDRSSLRVLTKQVHDMRAFFSFLSFSYVGRSCYAVVHLLAREGRGSFGPRFCIEEAPLIVE
ncbi:hypothetical protein GQ457_08G020710 [Hibiscus cannabinus]